MSVQPVQTFEDESRVYDGLSHGVLVVEESRLMAKVEDPIRVLYEEAEIVLEESPSRGAARSTLGRSVLALVLTSSAGERTPGASGMGPSWT